MGRLRAAFSRRRSRAYYVFNPGQSNIDPQTTMNYQLGAVYKSGDFTGDMDVYQITANNFPVTYTNTTGLTNYTNGGTARYRGFEAEGTYKIIQGLAFYASGAIIDARFLEGMYSGLRVGGARVSLRPPASSTTTADFSARFCTKSSATPTAPTATRPIGMDSRGTSS